MTMNSNKRMLAVLFALSLLFCACTGVAAAGFRAADFQNGYSIWRTIGSDYATFANELSSEDEKEQIVRLIEKQEIYREMDPDRDCLDSLKADGDESADKKPFYSVWFDCGEAAYRVDNWPKMLKAPGPSWEKLPIWQEKQRQENMLWVWRIDMTGLKTREERLRRICVSDLQKYMEDGTSTGWYATVSDEDWETLLHLLTEAEMGETVQVPSY